MKKIIFLIVASCCLMLLLTACHTKNESISDFQYEQIDKIQIISTMGNPEYGADSRVITDENEMKELIDTFNSGIIGKKLADTDIKIGFMSRYFFYHNGEVVVEYGFNANDTNTIWWNDAYRNISYGENAKTPFAIYQDSQSPKIVVDKDGQEMDLIRYNGDTFVKSNLSEETIEWLEMYNSLTEDEQLAISFSPDLGKAFKP